MLAACVCSPPAGTVNNMTEPTPSRPADFDRAYAQAWAEFRAELKSRPELTPRELFDAIQDHHDRLEADGLW